MDALARRATADDDAAVRARLGNHADAILGGVVAGDLVHATPESAAFVAGDAYGRVVRGPRTGSWLVAVTPAAVAARAAVLRAAAEHVRAHGGGTVTWWASGATVDDDDTAARAGYALARAQHQLRVALPLAEQARIPAGVTVRTFDAARDADRWIAVNNAAFADHAEQGGWTRATLDARMAESWFDPTLFLLAVDDASGDLAGFDWLKVHGDEDPPLGEIYAIGVAPGQQGRGLGRALAVEGLARVAARGITTGMLYVASDNTAALALYASLGFTTFATDRAYEQIVPSP